MALSLVLGLIGVLAYGFTRDPAELPSALLERSAPNFDLAVMPPDGGSIGNVSDSHESRVQLSSLRGSPVVLNYWASWCLACRAEHRALSAAAERYRSRGVRFFGILYQDTPENARRFIVEMGGQTYPTLLDPGSRTAIAYGVYGVPETYFIDGGGIIGHKHIGPVTPAVLKSWIETLLIDGPPNVE